MPPKRRSAGTSNTPTTRTQSTLSFNNKSRVTKQSNILPPSSDKKATSTTTASSKKRLSDQAKAEIEEQLSEHETPEVTEIEVEDEIETQEPQEQAHPQTKDEDEVDAEAEAQEDEATFQPRPKRKSKKTKSSTVSNYEANLQLATKLPDTKIKSYWKAEEASRLAPRVHQNSLPIHEKILRHFDLSSQYGPCIGIPRLERWKRASGLGMDPPIEVLAVLVREEKKGVDKGVGDRQCGKLAYIDELAGGRVVLVE